MFKSFIVPAMVAVAFAVPANAQSYLQLNLGSGFQTETTDVRDNATAFGVAGGYDYGKIRFEGELLRLDTGSNGGGRIGQVQTDVLFLNAYYEPFSLDPLTPYLGVGVGYGWSSGSGVRGSGDGFIFNIGGGVSYAIDKSWSLNAGYRYLFSDEIEVRPNRGRSEDFRAHLLSAGVRYSF